MAYCFLTYGLLFNYNKPKKYTFSQGLFNSLVGPFKAPGLGSEGSTRHRTCRGYHPANPFGSKYIDKAYFGPTVSVHIEILSYIYVYRLRNTYIHMYVCVDKFIYA